MKRLVSVCFFNAVKRLSQEGAQTLSEGTLKGRSVNYTRLQLRMIQGQQERLSPSVCKTKREGSESQDPQRVHDVVERGSPWLPLPPALRTHVAPCFAGSL